MASHRDAPRAFATIVGLALTLPCGACLGPKLEASKIRRRPA